MNETFIPAKKRIGNHRFTQIKDTDRHGFVFICVPLWLINFAEAINVGVFVHTDRRCQICEKKLPHFVFLAAPSVVLKPVCNILVVFSHARHRGGISLAEAQRRKGRAEREVFRTEAQRYRGGIFSHKGTKEVQKR